MRAAGLKAGTQRRQQDLTIARRLFLVAFTDFCCWFPVGLMGLLAAGGVPIPGEVNVWTAIFVLPLNSALNPFLYTLNRLMEKREKMRMEVFYCLIIITFSPPPPPPPPPPPSISTLRSTLA